MIKEGDLTTLLQGTLDRCQFKLSSGHVTVWAALRQAYQQGVFRHLGWHSRPPELVIDDNDPALTTFVEALREALSDCVDDEGRIGDGLAVLMGGILTPPIAHYAKQLLRAGATLGAEEVVGMLYGWKKGNRVRYKLRYVLNNGTSPSDPIVPGAEVVDGVHVSVLPPSTQDLWRILPDLPDGIEGRELLTHVLVTADMEFDGPVLFKPEAAEAPSWPLARPKAGGFNIDHFCAAMSLVENKNIGWMFSWGDYGVLREINGVGGGFTKTSLWPGEQITPSKTRLEEAWKLSAQVASAHETRLEVAIQRWLRARRFGFSADHFIDLRIALESLYAGGGHSEVRFRQATHGALHLGCSYAERQHYRKLLSDVYDAASGVVHTGKVKESDKSRNLLDKGRDACRKGILKCLADGGDIDLDMLMFNREPI